CRRQDHGRCPRDLHQEGSSLYREDRECRRRVWREFLSWGGTVAAAPEDGRKKRVAPVKATLKFFLSGEDPSGNCVAERHSAAATCIGFLRLEKFTLFRNSMPCSAMSSPTMRSSSFFSSSIST